MIQKSYDGTNSLYLIPTPIGNMDDITNRAIDTLNMVDYICVKILGFLESCYQN